MRYLPASVITLAATLLAAGAAHQSPARDDAPAMVVTPIDAPPSDAVVLFGGKGLDSWRSLDGSPAKWTVGDGVATVVAGKGNIVTAESFGDCQVHVEFRTPSPATGEGQNRGNSGVYFQTRYEVQVLDSFKSDTYHDGQCAAIYKKHVPLVNACREPGNWQTYDIIFRAPRFDEKGAKARNAIVTVLHNGVLVQDHAEVDGPTGSAASSDEKPAEKKAWSEGPLMLQEHGCAVSYRNIWVRRL